MSIVKPLVFVDRFDAEEIRLCLRGGAGGVVLTEQPEPALTSFFNRVGADARADLATLCYVEQVGHAGCIRLQADRTGTARLEDFPDILRDRMSRDIARVNQVDGVRGRLSALFRAETSFRWHVDSSPFYGTDNIYMHRHLSGAGLRLLNPKMAMDVRDDLLGDDAADYLRGDHIEALIAGGAASVVALKAGQSVFFSRHMAHASNPDQSVDRDRYLVFPFMNPKAVL